MEYMGMIQMVVLYAAVGMVRSKTCCADTDKCCGRTYDVAINLSCDSSVCCDAQCQGEALLSDIISRPSIPLYVRNSHDRLLSAGCCDFFFTHDGSLCRADFGDDCTYAKRCRLFAADCEKCNSYCAAFHE
uniref:SREBP regulating gene protein n=1 Tax=Aureoumbra lagunensis TaxID=44058 RepID=A0A7S3JUK1_9STRA|mmetsp:Transcript_20067/g.30546  ORF Transcript_20067/g.30546 Transcript_20067/m.30546 type:complete len:131 (-) Transcript_20067:363-755(-)